MNKIILTEEKETMLIPLLAKAKESSKENPIIIDKKAVEIVKQIDYDFNSLNIPEKTNIMMCIRAKIIDDFVLDFLVENKDNMALHIGCGLDSRYKRIDKNNVDWYDLDFTEVIDIRKEFFKETDNYHMIESSVTEKDWIKKIPKDCKKNIVIAEGLFMYLKEEEIKNLIKSLKSRLGNYTLIFDAYSILTAKQAKKHPSLKKTKAKINWGIDNPKILTKWDKDIKFIEEKFFTDSNEINKLDTLTKLTFKFANLFSMAKKAHRILIYEINN